MPENNKIFFEKPDILLLRRDHAVFDMHFHTCYTDGRDTVKMIAARARALGIGIAITDHNDIRGALEMNKYKDVPSIPGIEITSREGTHILVYFDQTQHLKKFYSKYIKPLLGSDIMSSTRLSMEEIVHCAKLFPSVTIFPHPYCVAYTGICNLNFEQARLERLLESVDGIEVINAGNIHRWNLRCALLGVNLKKAITGGSDGHSLYHMGKVVTYAACEKSGPAMLDAVKDGRACVVGKEINLFRKVAASSAKLNIPASAYPERLGKNIRYSYRVIHVKSIFIRQQLRLRFYRRGNKLHRLF
ncbi:MAG TPA: PHP domain-containing protein [Smithellaceae bacterium]|nr:PHP domain-containing protein [Smithellaceae bacterium]HPE07416.1 PHP domain-containing protein [Smithellaceae bacterium]HRY38179.1 PHP domain-containing protein [Smithellaceae bacterium]